MGRSDTLQSRLVDRFRTVSVLTSLGEDLGVSSEIEATDGAVVTSQPHGTGDGTAAPSHECHATVQHFAVLAVTPAIAEASRILLHQRCLEREWSTVRPIAGSAPTQFPAPRSLIMVATVSGFPISRLATLTTSAERRPSRLPLPVATEWTGTELVQAIAREVWDRMPLSKLDLSLDYDRTELARSYADSDQQLQQAAADVGELLAAIRDAAFVLRQDERISVASRADWLRQHRESLDESLQVPIVPPDTALNVKSMGRAGLAERLRLALRERVQQFASEVIQSLQRLAKQQIVGRIEWVNSVDCRFTFQQFALTQEFLGTETRRRRVIHRPTGFRGRETWSSEVLQNTSSVMRHEHELINARQHELSRTVFPIPQPVQNLIKRIPEWLQPLVRIVEGTQIKERIGEVDVTTETWHSTPQVVDRVLFGIDPALVFGDFVLSGWGQREVALELERQLAEQAASEQTVAEAQRSQDSALAMIVGNGALWSSVFLAVVAFAARSALSLYASWGLGVLAISIQLVVGELTPGASGFARAGRVMLFLLAVQIFGYGVSGAGIGMILLSLICGGGAAALHSFCEAKSVRRLP